MPSKPKYSYDIKTIEALENEGLSIRSIARKMGWSEVNTHAWIKRNFKKIIRYELK